MTIYTNNVQMGSRSIGGIFTSGVRFGDDLAPYSPQIVTPSWKRSCAKVYFGATCTITYVDDLSWRVVGDVGASGWFRGYAVFLVTVNSGAYGNTAIDAEVTCYSGSDEAELVGMSKGDICNGADIPTLSDGTTPSDGLAIGETKWMEGAGGHAYQTGYFSIGVAGNYHTGSKVDAYFRINRLRWGSVIIWDRDNKGIITNNVRMSHG